MDAVKILAGLTIGTISVVKPEAIPTFIKSLLTLPTEVDREYIATKRAKLQLEKETKMLPLEIEEKKLNNLEKKVSILEKLKALGVDTQKVETSATALADTFGYLQIQSAEHNLPDLPEDDENVLDHLLDVALLNYHTRYSPKTVLRHVCNLRSPLNCTHLTWA